MPLKVRVLLAFTFALGLVAQAGYSQGVKDDVSIARMKKDIFFLASEACEGRGVGTLGLDLAAQYIAVQFSQAGLKPGGVDGTYFQPFKFATGAKLDGTSTFNLNGPDGKKLELKQGTDFQVLGSSGPGKVNAPVVFVGYGITWNGLAYDDYAGVDVKGKIVIALRRLPRWNNKEQPFGGNNKDSIAALTAKHHIGTAHKAAAVILVNDASEPPKDAFNPFFGGISTVDTPYVQMKRAVLDDLLKSSLNKSLEEIEKAIDGDLKPRSAELTGWKAQMEIKLTRREIAVKNVIGYVDGNGPLADESIVVGSHYDHLGYGQFGGIPGGKPKTKTIYYGADDNGSGTTSMMELARRFAARKGTDGRRMVFMAFTAEESGLIGSRHYAQAGPLFSLKNTAAMFNLDMVGRYDPRIVKFDQESITVVNGDSSKTTYALSEKAKYFHLVDGVRKEMPEDVKDEVFRKLPDQGLSALIATDGKTTVTSVTVYKGPPLLVEGYNSAKEFDDLVTKLNPGFDIIKKNSRGFFASDQYNFYLQNIPVVFFWTGEHADYHRPSDIPERINIAGMHKIVGYAERVINDLRMNPKRPEYTPVNVKFGGGGGIPTVAPSLRFQPDPFFEGKGVRIDMIVAGGPAAKAGMKEGDIIIELAGKAITNVTSYNAARLTLKADVEVEVRILRDKTEMKLKITPVMLK